MKLGQQVKKLWGFHRQHNGLVLVQRYYERHFTSVGKALLLLFTLSLSLGMVGVEVLIYILLCSLGGLWGSVLLLGFLSRPTQLKLGLQHPRQAQAGQATAFQFSLENPSGRAYFQLQAEIMLVLASQAPLQLHSEQLCFCLKAGETVNFQIAWQPGQRGEYQIQEISVISLFPLGLIRWRQTQSPPPSNSHWVQAVPYLLPEPQWRSAKQATGHAKNVKTAWRGESFEFQGIRPWQTGDSPRHVHWPALARTGQVAVREYQGPEACPFALVLDTSWPTDTLDFEAAVSVATGWILRTQNHSSLKLQVAVLGEQVLTLVSAPGSRERLLKSLSTLQASHKPLNPETALKALNSEKNLYRLLWISCVWQAEQIQFWQASQQQGWLSQMHLVSAVPPPDLPASVIWLPTERIRS